ncbi:unnamed protein product [Ostreobium quekettii]|uniref:Uncharacterized protein n=1 Tax=Ostreobium quekettii TaxID=121088 RepID=A0A8S1IXY2_9CHLO|nr:unnamed protein product [Ostreobium quekettii]|eukprot:evm.model.scf_312.7 EVM.evm.TU.scf_312.7   scf_312:64490-67934(+)
MAQAAAAGKEAARLQARLASLQRDASTLIDSLAYLRASDEEGDSEGLSGRVEQDLEGMLDCLRELELCADGQETEEGSAQVALWLKEHNTKYERLCLSFEATISQAQKKSRAAWSQRKALLGLGESDTVSQTVRNKQDADGSAQDTTESLGHKMEPMASQVDHKGSSLEVIDARTGDQPKVQRELQSHRGLLTKSKSIPSHGVLEKLVLWGAGLLLTIAALYFVTLYNQNRVLGLTPGLEGGQVTNPVWYVLSAISHLPLQLGSSVAQNRTPEDMKTPRHRTERPLSGPESTDKGTSGTTSKPDMAEHPRIDERKNNVGLSWGSGLHGVQNQTRQDLDMHAPKSNGMQRSEPAWEAADSLVAGHKSARDPLPGTAGAAINDASGGVGDSAAPQNENENEFRIGREPEVDWKKTDTATMGKGRISEGAYVLSGVSHEGHVLLVGAAAGDQNSKDGPKIPVRTASRIPAGGTCSQPSTTDCAEEVRPSAQMSQHGSAGLDSVEQHEGVPLVDGDGKYDDKTKPRTERDPPRPEKNVLNSCSGHGVQGAKIASTQGVADAMEAAAQLEDTVGFAAYNDLDVQLKADEAGRKCDEL